MIAVSGKTVFNMSYSNHIHIPSHWSLIGWNSPNRLQLHSCPTAPSSGWNVQDLKKKSFKLLVTRHDVNISVLRVILHTIKSIMCISQVKPLCIWGFSYFKENNMIIISKSCKPHPIDFTAEHLTYKSMYR